MGGSKGLRPNQSPSHQPPPLSSVRTSADKQTKEETHAHMSLLSIAAILSDSA